jgi:hypothetical protein
MDMASSRHLPVLGTRYLTTSVADPDPGSRMGKKSGSGSGNSDPGAGIRNKHPGSATLTYLRITRRGEAGGCVGRAG